MNTVQANPAVRRSVRLAVLSFAHYLLPRRHYTTAHNAGDRYSVKAKVYRVPGGYALWLYRTPDNLRLPFNRLMVRNVVSGITFHADGTRAIRHKAQPFLKIGDALRAQRLYAEGNLPSDYLTDHVPVGWAMTLPDNADRAAWAENAVNTFGLEVYCGRTFTQTVQQQPEDGDDAYTMIQDLICDLMHLARAHKWEPLEVLRRATDNFQYEVLEELKP